MTDHTGPVHHVRGKRALAEHIGQEHRNGHGVIARTVWPDVAIRARWSRDELERTHAEMHQEDPR
jgi:hypothetical protein